MYIDLGKVSALIFALIFLAILIKDYRIITGKEKID